MNKTYPEIKTAKGRMISLDELDALFDVLGIDEHHWISIIDGVIHTTGALWCRDQTMIESAQEVDGDC